MFCPNCGEDLTENVSYCTNCGYSFVEPQKEVEEVENLSFEILVNSLKAVAKKPFILWGLSLLCGLLESIAIVLGGFAIGVGIAVGLVLSLGMAWVFLDGYREKEINAKQLFEPFYHFWRSFAGMGWRQLWIFIWSLIPFAGPIIGIIKGYSYSMVPYLLREKPEKSPDDVMKDSMDMTDGFKGRMFLTDVIAYGAFIAIVAVLCVLSTIPYIGVAFTIITVIVVIVLLLIMPLLSGLIRAAWYEQLKSMAR